MLECPIMSWTTFNCEAYPGVFQPFGSYPRDVQPAKRPDIPSQVPSLASGSKKNPNQN